MIKILNKTVVLIIILLFSFQTNAQIDKLAISATKTYYQFSGIKATPINYVIIDANKENKSIAFNFINNGWIIIKNDESREIMAFSKKGHFTGIDNPLMTGRQLQNGVISSEIKKTINSINFNGLTNYSRNTNNVDAFLTDIWGGVNCYTDGGSNVYPTNYYTPLNCSPGCVAISSSQILHYYEWPLQGVGSNVYKDNYTDRNNVTTLKRHRAHFDNHTYDWANMLDEYQGVASSTAQQIAVGTLMYDMGVAVEMDYEDDGSTDNLLNIPDALENYFRFSGTYHSENWSPFWTKVRESIENLRPIAIAIENSDNDEGHVFVADGIVIAGSTQMHHLNWGWYNRDNTNGWYNIRSWVPGGTGYDTILGAVFDMLPEPQITSMIPTGSGDDFTINWEVSNRLNPTEYTLEQKVDQDANWSVVATGITQKNYTISNPTGAVYLFRVKAMSEGVYYANSWSEREVYSVSGNYNGYGSFEGSQHVYARQTPDGDIDFTGDYTLETWVRVKSSNNNNDVILDQENVFGLTIQEVTSSDFSVKFTSHSSGNSIISSSNGSKPLNNTWVHVAVSKTGNNTKLYIDGQLRDSANSGFNLVASNNALNIGEKYHGGYSSYIVADFDQMRLSSVGRYSSDFTPNQSAEFSIDADTKAYFTFQNIHRNRLKDNAFKISVIATNSAGFVLWKFDDNSSANVNQQVLNDILLVYPNPTANYIKIDFKENSFLNLEELTFSITDLNGKEVKNTQINSVNNKINLSNLSNGTYFLTVKGKDFSASQKIIKQ